jgi:hypothetical protein
LGRELKTSRVVSFIGGRFVYSALRALGTLEKLTACKCVIEAQALLLYLKIGDRDKEAKALYSIGELLIRSDKVAAYNHFRQVSAL